MLSRIAAGVSLLTWIVILLISAATLDSSSLSTSNNIPPSELSALHDLYLATDGSHWNWKNTTLYGAIWNFSSPTVNPCASHWQGVGCSSDCSLNPCNIIELNLYDYDLVGSMPSSLANLQQLQVLNFSSNRLNGAFPEFVSNLSHLKVLDLGFNVALTGVITNSSLWHMSSLSRCSLDFNAFSGSIPSFGFTYMSNLTYFALAYGNLKGTIPSSISKASKLQYLNLIGCGLEGTIPSSVGDLQALQYFYVDNNYLVGTIPPEFGQLLQLKVLSITTNSISGNFPSTLSNLKNLREIYVQYNAMTGSLPGHLFPYWSKLVTFSASMNKFIGSIPDSIQYLTSLKNIVIGDNKITGRIPSSIVALNKTLTLFALKEGELNGSLPCLLTELTALRSFVVSGNQFEGMIPLCFENLTSVTLLAIDNNILYGTVPTFLTKNSELMVLGLHGNFLSGSISRAFATMPRLKYFYLNDNYFTGSIPTELLLCSITVLYMHNNFFNGTIPQLTQASGIEEYNIGKNELIGPIPSSIAFMSKLGKLYVGDNLLTGEIPPEIESLGKLTEFVLNSNWLTGKLPPGISNIPNLAVLLMQNNYFHGKLPTSETVIQPLLAVFGQNNMFSGTLPNNPASYISLVAFNLSSNHFTGTIPPQFSYISSLKAVDLSYNSFRGKVDNIFNSQLNLKELFLQNNKLSGQLANAFNPSTQRQLLNVDFSSNSFSGSIPSEVFIRCGSLLSFAVVKNCITGPIPASLCNCKAMRSLALDGLHTADSCQDRFFSNIPTLKTYQLSSTVEGSIPMCLFSLSYLKVLHLSGNGIAGSIPDDIVIGANLTDLSLSHNLLTGKIPSQIQTRTFQNLDLSFNKIGGTLSRGGFARYPDNSSLALQVNRLSGVIPNHILDTLHISILQGNIFGCINGVDSLPEHDQYVASYQCGSDGVNTTMYVWCVLIIVPLVIIVGVYVYLKQYIVEKKRQIKRVVQQWWSVFDEFHEDEAEGDNHVYKLGLVMKRLRKLTISISVFAMLVLLPTYAIVGQFYSTYTHQYIWFLAMMYLSGQVPAVLIFVLLLIMSIMIYRKLPRQMEVEDEYEKDKKKMKELHKQLDVRRSTIVRFRQSELQAARGVGGEHNERLSMVNKRWSKKIVENPNGEVKSSDTDSKSNSHTAKDVSLITNPMVGNSVDNTPNVEDAIELDTFDEAMEDELMHIEDEEIAKQELRQKELYYAVLRRRILVAVVNSAVVLLVNTGYVYATVFNVQKSVVAFLAFAVSLFKIGWGNVVLVDWFGDYVSYPLRKAEQELQQERRSKSGDAGNHGTSLGGLEAGLWQTFISIQKSESLGFLIGLSIFNNVVAPFIAAAVISPTCFYYMLVVPDEETVTYDVPQCLGVTTNTIANECIKFGFITRACSYSPPFSYSYECSSALLSSFAAIFMFRYIIMGLLFPIGLVVLKFIQELCFYHALQQNDINSLLHIRGGTFQLVSSILPNLLQPISEELFLIPMNPSSPTGVIVNPLSAEVEKRSETHQSVEFKVFNEFLQTSSVFRMSQIPPSQLKSKHIFHKDRILVSMVGDAAVLMTFGAIFPLLAFVISINLVIQSTMTQLMLGRFIVISRSAAQLHLKSLVMLIHEECRDVGRLFAVSIPAISLLATSFWGFALFDTLGDSVGWRQAVWILVVMVLAPAWIYAIDKSIKFYLEKKNSNNVNSIGNKNISRRSVWTKKESDNKHDEEINVEMIVPL